MQRRLLSLNKLHPCFDNTPLVSFCDKFCGSVAGTFLGMDVREAAKFQVTFGNLNTVIHRFISGLPPVAGVTSSTTRRRLLVIHTLARVAVIQLHYIFFAQDPNSHATVLSNAQVVTSLLRETDMSDFPFIDPIMGVRL